jgi:hypothetical protein
MDSLYPVVSIYARGMHLLNRQELLERLDKSREKLLVALEPLPDEALVTPGAMGSWSILDILAHLTAWESELVTALMRIKQGKKPTRLLSAYEDVDSYNEQRFLESKNRELDRIFDDLIGVRLQLEDWLMEFSDRELERPLRTKWAGKQALWEVIQENSFGHEAEHSTNIEEFAGRWLSKGDETAV